VLYLKWAEYQRLIQQDFESGLRKKVREDILFPKGHPTEPPKILLLYRRCEKWGNWWDGGQADQPHILMDEFDAVQSAIAYVEQVELPYLLKIHHDK
jgi:hypothetical protein